METDQARNLLEQERTRLRDVRSGVDPSDLQDESEGENVSELSGVDQHPADLGTETFNRERDFSILESVEAELADVEHAMGKLDQGTYGVCEACGKQIPDARLEVMPATRFCVDDQALAEQEARYAGPQESQPVAEPLTPTGAADGGGE